MKKKSVSPRRESAFVSTQWVWNMMMHARSCGAISVHWPRSSSILVDSPRLINWPTTVDWPFSQDWIVMKKKLCTLKNMPAHYYSTHNSCSFLNRARREVYTSIYNTLQTNKRYNSYKHDKSCSFFVFTELVRFSRLTTRHVHSSCSLSNNFPR